MDITFLALKMLSFLLGIYILLFGFLKKLNEWYYISKLGNKKHSLPPGDMGWPLLGNMWSFMRAFQSPNPESFIDNFIKRYGRTGIYRTHLYGKPSIIVCSPEACRKVMLDDEKFGSGYPTGTVKLLGKLSLHALPAPAYKRLRKLITSPISGHEALSMYIGYIEDCVMNYLDEWSSIKSPIKFSDEIREVFFNILTNIFLGSGAESIPETTGKYYQDMFSGLVSMAINVPGFSFYNAFKARKMLAKIIQGVLDQRKARRKTDQHDPIDEKKGMIDLFMEVEDENGQKLEDEDIVNLLILFLVAGHDSSATAATWASIFLHDNPEVLQQAKAEQEEILKTRPSGQKGLSLKEIRQMTYLSKVIDETLRVTNVSFANFQVAKVDTNIDDHFVPKGWTVLVWNREIHLNPENYENPKEFLPSRWDNHKCKAGAFMPFGAGIRICPGSELAKLQISIFFHYFLLNYKLEQINPGRPVVYLPGPKPIDHCLARVIKIPSP